MPYILVSNIKKLPLRRNGQGELIVPEITYIECQDYQDKGRSVLGDALSSVGVTRVKPRQYDQLPARPIPCMYNTASPPHVVLDALERGGGGGGGALLPENLGGGVRHADQNR